MKHFFTTCMATAFSIAALAQWTGSETTGTPVCTVSNTTAKGGLVAYTTPTGNHFLAWEDDRNAVTTGTDIYLQKINADGTLAYDAEGLLICNAAGRQRNISITSDGSDGVIVAWEDERTGSGLTDIYGQRVTLAGAMQWSANGIALASAAASQTLPKLLPFDASRFLLVWRDDRDDATLGQDIYYSIRQNSDGAASGGAEIVLSNHAGDQTNFQAHNGGSGGVFVVWEDFRNGSSDRNIYGSYISSAGTVGAGWDSNGKPICVASGNQLAPQLAADATGAFFSWGDQRISATDVNIYVSRLGVDGNLAAGAWVANGIQVTTSSGNQTNPRMVSDGASSSFVCWGDQRQGSGNRDIYVQKVAADGTFSFGANGMAIVTAPGNQPGSVTSGFTMISNNAAGAVIAWEDARLGTSNYNIYAQQIAANGDLLFPSLAGEEGAVVNTGAGNQRSPALFGVTNNKVTIAWEDSRTSSNGEILANQLNANGTLPITWLQLQGQWLKHPELQWRVATTEKIVSFVVERSEVQAADFKQVGFINNSLPNVSEYAFTDAAKTDGTVLYRIAAVYSSGKKEYSPVLQLQKQFIPNQQPEVFFGQEDQHLHLRLPQNSTNRYLLRVISMQGATLHQQVLPSGHSGWMLLNMQRLSSGRYTAFITDQNGSGQTFSFVKF